MPSDMKIKKRVKSASQKVAHASDKKSSGKRAAAKRSARKKK